MQRGGVASAGSIQEIGVDAIVILSAKAGVSATVRAGIIGTSIISATVGSGRSWKVDYKQFPDYTVGGL